MQTSPVISSNYDPFSKWPNLINLLIFCIGTRYLGTIFLFRRRLNFGTSNADKSRDFIQLRSLLQVAQSDQSLDFLYWYSIFGDDLFVPAAVEFWDEQCRQVP